MKPVIHLYSLYFAKCMSANVNAAQLHYAQHLASCPAVLQLLPATIYMNQETLLTQGAHCPPDLDIITEVPTNNSIMCIYHAPFALNFDTIIITVFPIRQSSTRYSIYGSTHLFSNTALNPCSACRFSSRHPPIEMLAKSYLDPYSTSGVYAAGRFHS